MVGFSLARFLLVRVPMVMRMVEIVPRHRAGNVRSYVGVCVTVAVTYSFDSIEWRQGCCGSPLFAFRQ